MEMDKLKIGPITYKIRYIDDLDEDGQVNGSIRYNNASIAINKSMDEQIMRQTIWHEAIHGLLTHSHVEHDESLVDILAYGIMQLLQDNPQLRSENG